MHRRRLLRGLCAAAVAGIGRPAHAAFSRGACGSALTGFATYCFTGSGGVARSVYVVDTGGPPVVLLHELPGLVDADLDAAIRLSKEGFTVVVPLLFGTPGGEGDWLGHARRICGDARFACNRGDRTSPEVAWLRELVRDVRETWPRGRGAGVVGMCLTGAFPLALLREPDVVAPVLLQPTVPFSWRTRFGWLADKSSLGVSGEDVEFARAQRDVPLLGIRYRGDWRCRRQRFEQLAKAFPTRFHRLDLDGDGHSVLGGSYCNHAFAEVTAFLRYQLSGVAASAERPFTILARTGVPEVLAPRCGWAGH